MIHDQLRIQRREIVEHIDRIYKVLTLKVESKNPRDETRAKNFHQRLGELEFEVRKLQKQGR